MAQSSHLAVSTVPNSFRAGERIDVSVSITNGASAFANPRLDFQIANGQTITMVHGLQNNPWRIGAIAPNRTITHTLQGLVVPTMPSGSLRLTAFLLDNDEAFVGEPSSPYVAEERFVYQCLSGKGRNPRTVVTTCRYKTPRQIARETRP